jgi:sugar lactone lactonase YvrE
MSKATTAIVSLLSVASVFLFAQVVPTKLAAHGSVSALFLFLVLASTVIGMDPRRSGRWGRRILRYAAPGLLVLLVPGMSWASFSLTFQGLVQTLNTGGSITLSSPSGIVVDTAGDVYVVDTGNGRIVEVNAQGVASVLAITGLSPALSSPNGIAIDGSGNLYVADTGNNRVVEITAAGAGSVISTGSVTLSSPKGVALDQSGDIFIADTANNRIVEVTSGGAAAALTITVSSGSATLNFPTGLAEDVTGKLYIADSNNNRIVTVAAGSTTGVVASILGGVTLSGPSAVTVDRMGNVFIADTNNSRIAEIDTSSNGTVLYTGATELDSPLGVALDVFGTVYIADTGDNQALAVDPPVNGDLGFGNATYSLNKTAVGFGHVQLGSSTAVTLTLPFTTGGSGGLGGVKVFTSGVQGLDFTSGTETTCDGSTGPSTYCTVEISFLPTAPGLRNGAVVLYDTGLNPILTVPLYGWGDAPVAALSPNVGSVVSTGGVIQSDPFQIALDGAGNIYVGEYFNTTVLKIPAGGGSAAVVPLGTPGGTAPLSITGIAIDGAGNLFIGDHTNSRILVVTPGGVVSVLTVNGLSPVLELPTALAFDAAGNLYVSDYGGGRVIRVSTLVVAGSTSSGLGTAIGTGAFTFGVSTLSGTTVDAQGNIYIAARTQNSSSIVKVTTAGVASELSFPGITPAISGPQGVAVDAMGNIYVVDSGNKRIVRLTTAGVASALGITGLPAPATLSSSLFGVTLDPWGNLYIPDWTNNRVVFVNVAASSLSFANTFVGQDSASQTTTVADLGNLPLDFSVDPTYTPDFSQATGGTNQCLSSSPLLSGTVCNVSVQFSPQSVALLSESIVLTNNNLNVTGATESIAVSGTGLNPGDTTVLALSASPSPANIGQPVTLTATVTDTTAGHTATVPTGGVTFMDTVGSTVISLNSGAAVPLNGAGVAILNGVTLSGAGAHTITANYAGVTNTFLASSHTTPLTVTTDTPTVTGPVTQPVQVTSGQTGSVPVTVTGPYAVVAVPTGSLTYNIVNSLSVSVASGTAPLTGGSTNSTATVPLASSLAAGTYTVSVIYNGDSNYAAVPAVTIPVVVSLITPVVNWTAPGPTTYGIALGGILDASAVNGSTPVAGSFAYIATLLGGSPVVVTSATVLGAGSYTLNAAFTPTDPAIYASASASVALRVAKATAVMTLGSSANPATAGSVVTFTVTVTSPAGTPSGSVGFYDGTTLLGSGTLALNVAALATSSLAAGPHTITSVYTGDSNFSALTSAVLTETVTTIVTTTTLVAAPNPAIAGQAVVFTATVSPAPTGTPAGSVSFYNGTTLLGMGTVVSGIATFTTSSLPTGGLSLTAVYSGNAGSAGSTSAAFSETVTAVVTTTALVAAPNPAVAGQAVVFTATVAPAPTGTPAGSVSFYNGTTLLGMGTVASGIATFTTSSLPTGGLSLTAVYSGNAGSAGSTSTAFTETVTAIVTTTALVAAPNPAIAGQAVVFTATVAPAPTGTPAGSVSFYNGTTLLGMGTVVSGIATFTTSSLPTGGLSLTAVYSGNAGSAGSTSTAFTETVMPADLTTVTTLTASPNPLFDGQPATLTATVAPAPTGSPAGIISFYSGTSLLGTGTLNSGGVATLMTSSLAFGADSITATYPGNAGFAASTSTAVSETVIAGYTVTGPSTPVSVAPGGSATFDLTVPPVGGPYDSVVTLSASGLPPGATATFNPPTVMPGTAGAPSVLTIQLATLMAGRAAGDLPADRRRLPLVPFSLAFVLFGAVLGRRRIPRTMVLALALTGLGVTASLLTGCGGGFANTPVTPAGSYTVTVTGTSGSFQASTTVTLVVTK